MTDVVLLWFIVLVLIVVIGCILFATAEYLNSEEK